MKESCRFHKVKIEYVNNGYLVEVGCEKFVFQEEKELIKALTLFYTDYF